METFLPSAVDVKVGWPSSYSLSVSLAARLVRFNLFLLLLMSLWRLLILFVYGPLHELPWRDFAASLWLGVRFDSVVLFYGAFLPVFALSLCWLVRQVDLFRLYWTAVKIYYWFLFVAIAFILAIDFGYYTYFQDHINIMIIAFFTDDTAALVRTFWKTYPVLWYGVGSIVVMWLMWLTIRRLLMWPMGFLRGERWLKLSWTAPLFFSSMIICVGVGARGSLGLFPLTIMDTVVSTHPFLNYLCFNGVHGLHRALKMYARESSKWNSNLKYYGYTEARTALADARGVDISKIPTKDSFSIFKSHAAANPWAQKTRPSVLVVIMESFGGHWLRYQSPSFDLMGALVPHWKQDLVFENFLPSSGATIGSLSSFMVGLPQRPFGPFLTESEFLNVRFDSSVPAIFKRAGFHTRLVYGGNPGWRDIDKFARKQGFDVVEGQVDIEKRFGGPLRETHDWGVYDEDLFKYVITTMSASSTPELVVVMTTTNHPPYEVPRWYRNDTEPPLFATGLSPRPLNMPADLRTRINVDYKQATDRFRAFQYSNQMLGALLTQVQSNPVLGGRTVVAVTGDHGFLLTNFSEQDLLEKWRVPFYLHIPSELKKRLALKPGQQKSFGSHMDIFPTIYPLVLSNQDYWSIGRNLLKTPPTDSFSVHNSQIVIGPAGAVVTRRYDQTDLYLKWNKNPLTESGQPQLSNSDPSPELERLSRRYKGLMSALDFYMHDQRFR